MENSLEDFLSPKIPENSMKVSGSMMCQECNETVHEGWMSEEDMIINYVCTNGHNSKVKL